MRPCLENTHHKKGLVEWLKVKALSSKSSTTRKQKQQQKNPCPGRAWFIAHVLLNKLHTQFIRFFCGKPCVDFD
jgi:hypothetical protein